MEIRIITIKYWHRHRIKQMARILQLAFAENWPGSWGKAYVMPDANGCGKPDIIMAKRVKE